jgi:nicotinamidase-related amidase
MNRETALLVIDVQVGIIDGPPPAYQGSEVLERIGDLLSRARASGTPVIYVQDDDVGGGPGKPAWEIHPAIAPANGERVAHKLACDAFYETTLKSDLENAGIKHLVIVGCKTQNCIDTTCRSATAAGYDVTLVGDAHTTTDSGTLSAAQIIAHHNETLDDFGNDKHVIRVKASKEVTFDEEL